MLETVIAPSVLAADWSRIREESQKIQAAGADWIHVDVMDGHFVPPITFGPQMVKALQSSTSLPLDVHLMIEAPEQQLAEFVKAGAARLTVHAEACPHLHRTVQQIRELGARLGVALNPATPVVAIEEILPELDLLLLMTVNPGWGGQQFIAASLDKIRRARERIEALGQRIYLQVDGGINPETAAAACDAGADVLVAGTSIFGQQDYAAAIRALRGA